MTKRQSSSKAKRIWLFATIFLAFLVLVYLGFAWYFHSHYLFRTTVGAIPCGAKPASYVEDINIGIAQDYLLTIEDRDGNKFPILAKQIDYQYDAVKEEYSILESQNPFTWPVSLFQDSNYDLHKSVTFDEDKLKEVLKASDFFAEDYVTPPVDASILLLADTYEVIPEVMGTTILFDVIYPRISSVIGNQQEYFLLEDDCYLNPSIYQTDDCIVNAISTLDRYTRSTIHYQIDGAKEELTKKDILSMVILPGDGTVEIDSDKLLGFVQQLATKYNTYADVRAFKPTKGDFIFIGGGDYGWVISKKKEMAQILEDLKSGFPIEREPVYEQRAKKSGTDDIGDTYVEVDYTNQHMWYYEDGELILDSDFVSGNLSKGNGSPDGIFKIVYKERNATLVGEDYESSVKYFMPFAYNVGFHDASWRSRFGDEYYLTSGSHGCINLPEKTAKALYEHIAVGTPVVAYYREPVQLTSENARIANAFSYVSPEEIEE